MGIHDKMIADQVWVRPHSTHDKATPKSMGQYFFMYQAPNFRERIEMSYRALGKQFDWDLEKYRLSRKPADKGNRRRLVKNIVKICKNPGGYFLWKTFNWGNFMRLPIAFVLMSLPLYFIQTAYYAELSKGRQEWIRIQGGIPPESILIPTKNRDSKRNIPMTFLWQCTYSHLPASFLVANPNYNQNFRLYFDRMPFAQK